MDVWPRPCRLPAFIGPGNPILGNNRWPDCWETVSSYHPPGDARRNNLSRYPRQWSFQSPFPLPVLVAWSSNAAYRPHHRERRQRPCSNSERQTSSTSSLHPSSPDREDQLPPRRNQVSRKQRRKPQDKRFRRKTDHRTCSTPLVCRIFTRAKVGSPC